MDTNNIETGETLTEEHYEFLCDTFVDGMGIMYPVMGKSRRGGTRIDISLRNECVAAGYIEKLPRKPDQSATITYWHLTPRGWDAMDKFAQEQQGPDWSDEED